MMTAVEFCRLCAKNKKKLIGICDIEGEKLDIKDKITKCLRIEVSLTDDLPLSICIDCYILLNQYHEFFERSNKAQNTLKHLVVNLKSVNSDIVQDINYISKCNEVTEEEIIEKVNTCVSPTNCSDISIQHVDDSSCSNDDKSEKKFDKSQDQEDSLIDEKKYKSDDNKCNNRSPKKRIKRKNELTKLNNMTLHDDSQKFSDRIGIKNNMKIPDNYMMGTDSDIEQIETQNSKTKSDQQAAENYEKYPWLCTDCNDKLPSLEALENHHATVHNQQAKYMCIQCCKVYDKYYGFLTHVKRHKNKTKYECESCGKSFIHKKVLESHKAIHSDERPYICQTCGKAFRQQSALYIHSRCHLPETMKNRFPCDQCNKRFSTKPNLVTHKRIHSGVRNFTCDQCGKSFIQKGNLEAHFLTHSADKPYSCTQCPKAFKTSLQLKKHETVHTGAKPHQCAICGRTFREKGTLREHHRIHTGAMPFTCEFCGKCFRFKGILTTHRRQHTGERPYSCVECQHHFTNWPNYNKHMKRRHGINTSHMKHLQQPQEHQESSQSTQNIVSENPLAIPNIETTSVQVIQTLSHTTVEQPIIVQTTPNTTIQTFHNEETNTAQEAGYRERNTSYFSTVSNSLQNFMPSYNFYNISNVTDNDLIEHR